jgi:hypothetical protein
VDAAVRAAAEDKHVDLCEFSFDLETLEFHQRSDEQKRQAARSRPVQEARSKEVAGVSTMFGLVTKAHHEDVVKQLEARLADMKAERDRFWRRLTGEDQVPAPAPAVAPDGASCTTALRG